MNMSLQFYLYDWLRRQSLPFFSRLRQILLFLFRLKHAIFTIIFYYSVLRNQISLFRNNER